MYVYIMSYDLFHDYGTWFLDPLCIPQLQSLQSEPSDLQTWTCGIIKLQCNQKKLVLCTSLDFHIYIQYTEIMLDGIALSYFVEYDIFILKTFCIQKLDKSGQRLKSFISESCTIYKFHEITTFHFSLWNYIKKKNILGIPYICHCSHYLGTHGTTLSFLSKHLYKEAYKILLHCIKIC